MSSLRLAGCPTWLDVRVGWMSESAGCPSRLDVPVGWMSESAGCPVGWMSSWLDVQSAGCPVGWMSFGWMSESAGCPSRLDVRRLDVQSAGSPVGWMSSRLDVQSAGCPSAGCLSAGCESAGCPQVEVSSCLSSWAWKVLEQASGDKPRCFLPSFTGSHPSWQSRTFLCRLELSLHHPRSSTFLRATKPERLLRT